MLVLASASPRRIELLRSAGFDPLVDPAHIDEAVQEHQSPDENAARLAREKAEAVAARHPSGVVLGADTVVVVDSDVLGKPRDRDDARAMLERLSGRGHRVLTAVCFVPPTEKTLPHVTLNVSTTVLFRKLTARDIDAYLATEEWRDKAGGYAIQGFAAGCVKALIGSYTNVVGLPLAEVVEELERFEIVPGALR